VKQPHRGGLNPSESFRRPPGGSSLLALVANDTIEISAPVSWRAHLRLLVLCAVPMGVLTLISLYTTPPGNALGIPPHYFFILGSAVHPIVSTIVVAVMRLMRTGSKRGQLHRVHLISLVIGYLPLFWMILDAMMGLFSPDSTYRDPCGEQEITGWKLVPAKGHCGQALEVRAISKTKRPMRIDYTTFYDPQGRSYFPPCPSGETVLIEPRPGAEVTVVESIGLKGSTGVDGIHFALCRAPGMDSCVWYHYGNYRSLVPGHPVCPQRLPHPTEGWPPR
jgi:hypothetical protein